MLEAARSERDLERDVLLGIAETHAAATTRAPLAIGLEILPRLKVTSPRRDGRGARSPTGPSRESPGLILVHSGFPTPTLLTARSSYCCAGVTG